MYIIVGNSKISKAKKIYFSHKTIDYWSMGVYYAVLFSNEAQALETIELLKCNTLDLEEVENIHLELE